MLLLMDETLCPQKGQNLNSGETSRPHFGQRKIGLFLKGTRLRPTRFIKNSATAIAFEKAFSPLDRDEGNEEKADIVVEPFEPCRGQATVGTGPRLVIHCHFSGLYSTDKDEGASPPDHSVHLMKDRKPLCFFYCKIFRIFPH